VGTVAFSFFAPYFIMHNSRPRQRAIILLSRGLRLRCPRCGARTLFKRWLTMHQHCASCHLRFEREQGYFIGAMYMNYALTVVITVSGYFALEWLTNVSLAQQLTLWGSVSILTPLALFRHARGLWLSFDYIFNPVDDSPTDS
jgi:uncharacterized protein (DUF983 family)